MLNITLTILTINLIFLSRKTLDYAKENINSIDNKIKELKERDAAKLKEEYSRLVEGLRQAAADNVNNTYLSNPALPADILEESIPGGDAFILLLLLLLLLLCFMP